MIIHEIRSDGMEYDIGIYHNNNGKFQYVNLTKEKICPCEFDTYEQAFSDLLKYINEGKISALVFKQIRSAENES